MKLDSFPHLVLGISSHADVREAPVGFAHASRRIRSSENSPFSMSDLTSALSQVENIRDETKVRFEYALPADPRVYKTNLRLALNAGVFSESDDLAQLVGATDYGKPPEAVGFLFLNAAIYRVLSWEWSAAASYARECLRLSRQEEVRDEALNVLGVSLAFSGEINRAVEALKKAVEGRWTLGLQTNLSILAGEIDQELAIRQMAFLIAGEREPVKRLAACQLAIAMWQRFQKDSLENNKDVPPLEILHASRLLLADGSLSEKDFYELGSFLANTDSEALRHSRSIDVSPHRRSPSGVLVEKRLDGYEHFLAELVRIERTHRQTHPWISDDLNEIVDTCVSMFLEQPDVRFATSLSFHLIKEGLDCMSFNKLSLRCLTVLNLLQEFTKPEECPTESLVSWLEEARTAIESLQLVPEQKEHARSLIDMASDRLAFVYLRSYANEGQQIQELARFVYDSYASARGRSGHDRNSVLEARNLVESWCVSVDQLFERLTRLAQNRDLTVSLRELQSGAREIRSQLLSYSR